MRRLLALLIAVCASVIVASALSSSFASAQAPPSTAYPPDEQKTVTVLNPTGPPGYTVRVVVDGCIPGETIIVTLGDQTVEATCDDTTMQVIVEIPAPSVPGVYDVVVTCPDRVGSPTITSAIEVVESPPVTTAPPPGPLPRTGSDSVFGSLWLAAGLLVAGGGMVVVARLRSTREASSGSDA